MGVVMDKTLTAAAVLTVVVAVWAGLRWLRDRARPWPHVLILAALLASSACGVASVLTIPTQTPAPPVSTPDTPPVPDIAILTVAVTPPTAVVQVGERKWSTREDGTIVEEFSAGTYAVTVTAPGYVPKHFDITLQAGERKREPVTLQRLSAPWETVTDAELRAWTGAIATVLWDGPCGHRPGQPDNTLFTAQYDSPCYDAATRSKMRAAYPYTHWAIGPIVQKGYHGYWPDTDWRVQPDVFLDRVDELWWAGKRPAIFVTPDTGLCADGRTVDFDCMEREFGPIYRAPRFQSRARIVVLAWEPAYDRATWLRLAKVVRGWFPSALIYIHMESGHGAPGHGYELAMRYPSGHPQAGELMPGEPNEARPFLTEGEMWGGIKDPSRPGYTAHRESIAALLDGELLQDTWAFGGYTDEGRTPEEQVLYDAWDRVRRFRDGYAGWPTNGYRGLPLDVVVFEFGSYYTSIDNKYGWRGAAEKAEALGCRLLREVQGIAGVGDGLAAACRR